MSKIMSTIYKEETGVKQNIHIIMQYDNHVFINILTIKE